METILLYLIIGAAAGLIAGAFGLGGGVIIVPMLIISFTSLGLSESVLTHMAIGTSLATIVATSTSSIYAHHRRGAVLWPVIKLFVPGICLGAVVGALFASSLEGGVLQILFGLFLLMMGLQMIAGRQPSPHRELPGNAGVFAVSSLIGFASSLIGIAGGSLSVPYFNWCNVKMREAVATSAACGFPISLMGAATYMVSGWHSPELPPGAFGYIYLPALVGIVATSMLFANLGARLAHFLPERRLKRVFGVLLLLLGGRFLWVNLV